MIVKVLICGLLIAFCGTLNLFGQDDCGVDAYVIDKDPKGLNVRDQPSVKGKVLATLKTDPNSGDGPGSILVRVTGYSNGWVKIVRAYGDSGSLFEGTGWVSAKMVATGTMGPIGQYNKPADLYAASNTNRKIGTIPSESEVSIAGFTCNWVKVKYKRKIGWIKASNVCGSPVTSCS
ncbi:MAG: SH3 domain-containing protein [Acidobacteria bacterium]|nr:SH3 domain-containing protein [Acidobacteriota bacterium]